LEASKVEFVELVRRKMTKSTELTPEHWVSTSDQGP